MTSPQPTLRSILIIRHGATALNSDDSTVDRIRSWDDWQLSENGIEEAWGLAGRVADNPPDVLLTSDLVRAQQTAVIIADAVGIPLVEPGMDFRPWNVGHFAGAPSATAVPRLAVYAGQKPDTAVPGGESFNTFRIRLFSGLRTALRDHEGIIGIVTHHRCERLIKAWAKAQFPENGAIDEAEFTRKGDPTGHCEIIQIPLDRLDLWWNWLNLQYLPNRNFHDSDLAMITLEEKKRAIHGIHPNIQSGQHPDTAVREFAGTDVPGLRVVDN